MSNLYKVGSTSGCHINFVTKFWDAGNDKYSKLHAAYFFYSVAEKHSWFDVMKDALIFARDMNVDVFNALDLMQNSEWLKVCMRTLPAFMLHFRNASTLFLLCRIISLEKEMVICITIYTTGLALQ